MTTKAKHLVIGPHDPQRNGDPDRRRLRPCRYVLKTSEGAANGPLLFALRYTTNPTDKGRRKPA
jgi:hypothetical protein